MIDCRLKEITEVIDLQYLKDFWDSFIQFDWAKPVLGVLIGLIHVLFGDVMLLTYRAIIILVMFEFLSALYVDWKNPICKPSPARVVAGLVKYAVYGVALAAARQAGSVAALSFTEGAVAGVIVASELLGVLNNCSKILYLHNSSNPWLDKLIKMIENKAEDLTK